MSLVKKNSDIDVENMHIHEEWNGWKYQSELLQDVIASDYNFERFVKVLILLIVLDEVNTP